MSLATLLPLRLTTSSTHHRSSSVASGNSFFARSRLQEHLRFEMYFDHEWQAYQQSLTAIRPTCPRMRTPTPHLPLFPTPQPSRKMKSSPITALFRRLWTISQKTISFQAPKPSPQPTIRLHHSNLPRCLRRFLYLLSDFRVRRGAARFQVAQALLFTLRLRRACALTTPPVTTSTRALASPIRPPWFHVSCLLASSLPFPYPTTAQKRKNSQSFRNPRRQLHGN